MSTTEGVDPQTKIFLLEELNRRDSSLSDSVHSSLKERYFLFSKQSLAAMVGIALVSIISFGISVGYWAGLETEKKVAAKLTEKGVEKLVDDFKKRVQQGITDSDYLNELANQQRKNQGELKAGNQQVGNWYVVGDTLIVAMEKTLRAVKQKNSSGKDVNAFPPHEFKWGSKDSGVSYLKNPIVSIAVSPIRGEVDKEGKPLANGETCAVWRSSATPYSTSASFAYTSQSNDLIDIKVTCIAIGKVGKIATSQ